MKKAVVLIISVIMAFCFSGCAEEARPDMTVLSERMAQVNENYAFDYFDTFVYEDASRVFFSLCSEDDVMLTIKTDENGKIDRVNITAVSKNMKTDGEREAYKNFSSAVIAAFAALSEKEKEECDEALSYDNTKAYFSDLYETYSALRYDFIFSSNSEYISLDCEYFEVIELTEDKQ